MNNYQYQYPVAEMIRRHRRILPSSITSSLYYPNYSRSVEPEEQDESVEEEEPESYVEEGPETLEEPVLPECNKMLIESFCYELRYQMITGKPSPRLGYQKLVSLRTADLNCLCKYYKIKIELVLILIM